ncbi:immunoglobulin-like domain-containing protein [Carnobacterium maltaromaticum]|uniref:immunoglobulin-like domain-containing protein n=1 Tax=Carnobacterium maltaromaticum TaxID=2751 RepID=UPI0018CD8DB4|nr:immunoglobulin-like domain-containing protein [Carnobacterium maltaromaticum]
MTYSVHDSDGLAAESKSLTVYVTNEAPTISAPSVEIQIDTEFNPLAGVTAYDKESGDVTSSIQVSENRVDTTKEGSYAVRYTVEDGNGKDATVIRNVTVTNEAPVIHAEDKVFHVLAIDSFTMEMALEGVTISDREDGVIPPTASNVNQEELAAINVSVPGSYPLTYTVADKHGKVSTKTIQIKIVNDSPIIEGTGDLVLYVGAAFDPLEGVTVSDTEEGSLLDRLVVVDLNQFDSNTPGTYQFIYTVEDSFGGRTEKVRTITIVEELPTIPEIEENTPTTETPEEKAILTLD